VTNLLDNAAVGPRSTPSPWSSRRQPAGGDEGPGIAEEDLPHVFDRFYRATESRSMPGSGLGLAIVRQVAERHGGMVRAGASPSGGAAFRMTVPGTAESDTVERSTCTPEPTTPPATRS
jgi:two-component system sensor histidine kinase MprB